eukprot:scaffold37805_cov254-Skeletonema_marinoi.AAC.1
MPASPSLRWPTKCLNYISRRDSIPYLEWTLQTVYCYSYKWCLARVMKTPIRFYGVRIVTHMIYCQYFPA